MDSTQPGPVSSGSLPFSVSSMGWHTSWLWNLDHAHTCTRSSRMLTSHTPWMKPVPCHLHSPCQYPPHLNIHQTPCIEMRHHVIYKLEYRKYISLLTDSCLCFMSCLAAPLL